MWINGRAPEWEPQLASSGLCCEPLHCGIETEPQSFLDAQKQGRSESRHRHRNDRLGVVESWVASSQAACPAAVRPRAASTATAPSSVSRWRVVRRVAEAANGTGEAKDALAQMGIALRDQSGNLRRSEDLLGDVADAFTRIEDPAERVRLPKEPRRRPLRSRGPQFV
jgi:hypothetical protein